MPVAAVDAPDSYDFWARGVWGEVSERMVATIGRLGALPTHRDPASRRRAVPPGSQPGSTSSWRRSGQGRQEAAAGPVAYPKSEDAFPRRLAGLAAMLAAGLPLHVVALSAPGGYDTHDNQAGTSRTA